MDDDAIHRIGGQVREHDVQLKQHNDRIHTLERDFMELTKDFREVQASLTKMELMLHTLSKDMTGLVIQMEQNIKLALTTHENKEFMNQRGMTVWLATTLITVLGAVGWAVFQRVFGGDAP